MERRAVTYPGAEVQYGGSRGRVSLPRSGTVPLLGDGGETTGETSKAPISLTENFARNSQRGFVRSDNKKPTEFTFDATKLGLLPSPQYTNSLGKDSFAGVQWTSLQGVDWRMGTYKLSCMIGGKEVIATRTRCRKQEEVGRLSGQ